MERGQGYLDGREAVSTLQHLHLHRCSVQFAGLVLPVDRSWSRIRRSSSPTLYHSYVSPCCTPQALADDSLGITAPYACAYVVTILVALSAERYNARSLHAFFSMLIGSIAFLVQALLPPTSFKARYGMLCIASAGGFAGIPQLIAWLTLNLHSTGAVGLAIALNISFGGPGQIIGTWIYKADEAPRYRTGHMTNFAVLLAGSVIVLGLRLYYGWKNARLGPGDKKWFL